MLLFKEEGFEVDSFEETYDSLVKDFRSVVGDDFVFYPSSPQAQMLGIFTKAYKDVEDSILFIANMLNPYLATGRWLEQRVAYAGILRKQKAYSFVYGVEFLGSPNAVFQAGMEFRDENNYLWTLDKNVHLDSKGWALGSLKCTRAGEIDLKVESKLEAVLINNNLQSVTVKQSAELGSLEETDGELLARFMRSHALNNGDDRLGLRARLLQLEDVKQVRVFEHYDPTWDKEGNLNYFDSNGVPLHSCNCVVLGGEDEEIAKTILKHKIGGCGLFGKIEVETFFQEAKRVAFFDRPNLLYPKLFLRLKRLKKYTDINEDEIKANLAKLNFEIGENIYASRLYCVVNETQGFDILTFEIDEKTLLEVEARDLVIFLAENIEIIVL